MYRRQPQFSMFSIYAQILSAYSPTTLRYFLRIFQLRRKNEEYAERIFHHQQCLGTSKGQCFEKIESGVHYLPRMNSLPKNFFLLSLKQKLLYAYTETTLNGEISTLSVYISVNTNTNFKKI